MSVLDVDAAALRNVDRRRFAALHEQFPRRWSPRAMTGEPLSVGEMETLVEAARWAPSCFNAQPWRFAYTLNGDAHWAPLFATLVEGNRAWACRAGALVAVAARRAFERDERPADTAVFDAGAAWMSLALQASHMGLVAHGMYGFDPVGARKALELRDVYALCALVAVGRPGERDDLPEKLRARESPSPRRPLDEICFPGSFRALTR